MKEAIFIYNELLDEKKQELYKLPINFICFAYLNKAKLYNLNGKCYITKTNINNKVYGALYILDNSHQNIRILDAIMGCSRSITGKNHIKDMNWREKVTITPINFNSIEDFMKMRYNEKSDISVITYFANINNNYIKNKVIKSYNRETCDFDIENLLNLLLKVKGEKVNEEN